MLANEVAVKGGLNSERVMDLELYRAAHPGTEIVTFDELYERASFIVDG